MTNLKEIRLQMKYTQAEIAEVIEMEQTHYSKYELGKHELGIDKYKNLPSFTISQ